MLKNHGLSALPRDVQLPPPPPAALRANAASVARSKGRPRGPAHPTTSEPDYSPHEFAFLKACDAFKRKYQRPFLTACDHLRIAASLGWTPPAHAATA